MNAIQESRGSQPRPVVPAGGQGVLFTDALPESLRARADTLAGTDIGGLYRNLADFALVAAREEDHLAGLADQVAPSPVIRVPFLRSDVHDLTGLRLVGDHLFGRT